jgi:Domain of unknown function (DUF1737)
MRYTILTDHTSDGLVTQVTGLLSQGWQPLGGVSVCSPDDARYARGVVVYAQALVHA